MADEKKTLDIIINDAEAAKSLGDIKKALKDLKNRMIEVGEDSAEFDKLAQSAARLKERMGEANEAIGRFSPKPIEAVGQFAQKSAAGLQAITAGMALFGKESEDVQKIMMKVQAAMAFSDAIKGLEGMQTVVINLFRVIAANPIGALVTALALVGVAAAAYFHDWTEGASEVAIANKALKQTTEDYENAAKGAVVQVNEVRRSFDDAKNGVISKEDALKNYNDTLGASLGFAKDLNEAESIMVKKADIYIKMTGLKAQANALYSKAADSQAEALTAHMKDNIGVTDILEASTTNLFDIQGQVENLRGVQAANTQQIIKDKNKEADAYTNLANSLMDQVNALQAANDIVLDPKKNAAPQKKADDNRILQEAHTIQSINALRVEGSNFNAELTASTVAFNQRLYDEDVEAVRKAEELKKQIRKDNAEFALNQASSLLGSLSALTKKHAKLSKAFAIGQALIDTYLSASKAYASQMSLPTPDAPIRAAIAAGIAVAAGLARVAQIRGINENGSGGGGGGGATGGGGLGTLTSSIEPNVNTSSQPSTLLTEQGQIMNSQNQMPIFVSVSEINSVNNNVTAIEDRSVH